MSSVVKKRVERELKYAGPGDVLVNWDRVPETFFPEKVALALPGSYDVDPLTSLKFAGQVTLVNSLRHGDR